MASVPTAAVLFTCGSALPLHCLLSLSLPVSLLSDTPFLQTSTAGDLQTELELLKAVVLSWRTSLNPWLMTHFQISLGVSLHS